MIDNNITPKQEEIIMALLTSKTKREACQMSGVSEATLYRLLKNPQFVEMLETVRKQIYYNIVFNLSSLSYDSIDSLHNLIVSPSTSAPVKCNASKFVLDTILKTLSYEKLERRIARLERLHGI